MLTYQDFMQYREQDIKGFIRRAISEHQSSEEYKIAKSADNYDKQKNETINDYVRTIFTLTGEPVVDFTASNNKISSNFFHRLNTQRCTYLLGNGVSFSKNKETQYSSDGSIITVDKTKEVLGDRFDTDLMNVCYKALIHGISFGFWNLDRLYVFPLTEFKPFWDEDTGALRAGIRYWQLDSDKPMIAVLYEEDGYTKYKSKSKAVIDLEEVEPKRPYKLVVAKTDADGEEVVGYENYGRLPIVPLWGSTRKQSTLIGLRSLIDSYDLIRSGFANDLTDCSQVYWLLENCGGMSDSELARFRDRLKINHIAVADTDNSKVTPYAQDIPYQARKAYLDDIRSGIYEDFGGLDVHAVAAGATNDHIDAAYQPLDEEADAFEYQVTEFVQQVLVLAGIDDVPVFKRNRISNEMEQVQMVMMEADYLDDETVLSKLPNITIDEVQNILAKRNAENEDRFEEDEAEEFEDEVLEEEEDTEIDDELDSLLAELG